MRSIHNRNMSNTESICCSVGHETNTDQLDGQNHLHAAERKKMNTALGCKCWYHEHRHVHFEEAHSSESEDEKDQEEEKKLETTTDSEDSYSIDLPRRRPHMAYLKMKHNMNITIESVEKIANNLNKLMTVVKILKDKEDELQEIQAMTGNGCGLSCTNNSLTL